MRKAKKWLHENSIQSIYLTNTSKHHNKFYQVDFCYNKSNDEYEIHANWGPIGCATGYQVKGTGKDVNNMIDTMEKVLLQKLFKKGYEVIDIECRPDRARVGDEKCFDGESWD